MMCFIFLSFSLHIFWYLGKFAQIPYIMSYVLYIFWNTVCGFPLQTILKISLISVTQSTHSS